MSQRKGEHSNSKSQAYSSQKYRKLCWNRLGSIEAEVQFLKDRTEKGWDIKQVTEIGPKKKKKKQKKLRKTKTKTSEKSIGYLT